MTLPISTPRGRGTAVNPDNRFAPTRSGKGVGLVEVRPLAIWQAEDAGNAPVEAGTTDDLPDIPDGYEVKRGPRGRWKVLTKDPLLEIAKEIMTEVEARNIALAHYVKANKVAA